MKIRIIRIPDQYKYGGELNASKWKHADGGPLKKGKYEDWYKTVPADRNDTTSYNLKRAYELAPYDELEAWRTSSIKDLEEGKNHLRSVYLNPNTGVYEFMKSKNHPTLHFETDWYNSNDPEAVKFRKDYDLDMSGDYYKYVPKKKAFGGDLLTNGAEWSNGLITVNNGGTHEENPYEGVQMGIDPQGVPNLVEEGEVIFNDYVFSNRLKPTEEMKKKNKYRGETFADVAKYLQRESKERPNDPISKRGLEDSMNKLTILQESIREKDNKNQDSNRYDFGSYLRYAPVLGSVIGLGQNLFSSPDYSGPDSIIEASNQLGRYTPITYTPIGNYLQYKPFDRNYYTNKLNAQAGATRRAIMNTTSPSRNAALLAADYNAIGRLGDLTRQAEEYNLAQRERVEGFNRQTNMANAEMGLKASMANQEASLKSKSQRLSGLAQAAAMKDTIDSRRSASTSANLTNLFESLGNIGIDSYNRADRDMLIKSGVFGTLSQKPQDWSDKRWNDYKKTVLGTGYSKGGKLKKRKGGLTY